MAQRVLPTSGAAAAAAEVCTIIPSCKDTDRTSGNGADAEDDNDNVVKEFTVTGNRLLPTPDTTAMDTPLHNNNNDDDYGDQDYSDQDDYDDDEDDEDEEDHVIGECLHCHLPPPPTHTLPSLSQNSPPHAPGIQVSCDDCHSFICSACHWCHEYQANHEIRVCDRCDAFYCKACDEMDQCEDCGEVVCAGCGALCSCKFCGCGLCEDCATACGRCGIVLCARDAKFAVECDTCKMSYCLVCLASGTKDPCVRCGHRTSKRVEQLVHLRLKSIYKAFKQSGAAIGNNGNHNNNNNGGNHNQNNNGNSKVGNGPGGNQNPSIEDGNRYPNNHNHESEYEPDNGPHPNNTHNNNHNNNRGRNPIRGGRGKPGDYSPPPPHGHGRSTRTWMAKKTSQNTVSMPLPASVARYAELHGTDWNKRGSSSSQNSNAATLSESVSLKGGNVGAVLQAAAAAAAAGAHAVSTLSHQRGEDGTGSVSSGGGNNNGGGGGYNHSTLKGLRGEDGTGRTLDHYPTGGDTGTTTNTPRISCLVKSTHPRPSTPPLTNLHDDFSYPSNGHHHHHPSHPSSSKGKPSDRYAARTQEEADAAAAALLAELEEERMLTEASTKAKKNKKKKKKEKQQQAAAAKEKERLRLEREREVAAEAEAAAISHSPMVANATPASLEANANSFGRTANDSETSGTQQEIIWNSSASTPIESCGMDGSSDGMQVNSNSEKTGKKKKKKKGGQAHTDANIHSKVVESATDSGLNDGKPLKQRNEQDDKNEKENTTQTNETVSAAKEDNSNEDSEEEYMVRLAGETNFSPTPTTQLSVNATTASASAKPKESDDIEKQLADMVSANDLEGIENLLAVLKGVPGRAALRKNAKKAVKRINEEKAVAAAEAAAATQKAAEEAETENARSESALGSSSDPPSTAATGRNGVQGKPPGIQSPSPLESVGGGAGSGTENLGGGGYKAPEPLLKLVSHAHRVPVPPSSLGQGALRTECVMHMAPSVVGWVIGKGGQRIRDLMEESGAKVWIDQDSMGPKDMRIVYVSGSRKSVDTAVRMVKELVAKAPVGGATISGSIPQAVNDSASVASTRSSLTSTPLSFIQTHAQQNPSVSDQSKPAPTSLLARSHSLSTHVLTSGSGAAPSFSDVAQSAPGSMGYAATMPASAPASASNSPSRGGPPAGFIPSLSVPTSETGSAPMIPNQSAVSSPKKQIPGMREEDRPATAVHEITCEPRFVPLLIGKRGWTVKQIQDSSGARVDIDQTVTPRRVIISGEAAQVEHAKRLVFDVLSYPDAHLHYSTPGVVDRDMESSSLGGDLQHGDIPGSFHSLPIGEANDLFYGNLNSTANYAFQQGLPQQNSASHQYPANAIDYDMHHVPMQSDFLGMMHQQQYHGNEHNEQDFHSSQQPPRQFVSSSFPRDELQPSYRQQDVTQFQPFNSISSSPASNTAGTSSQERYTNQHSTEYGRNLQYNLAGSGDVQHVNASSQHAGSSTLQSQNNDFLESTSSHQVAMGSPELSILFGKSSNQTIDTSAPKASMQGSSLNSDNFHLDTILPLSRSSHDPVKSMVDNGLGQANVISGKSDPSPFVLPGQNYGATDRDIIDDMFGPSCRLPSDSIAGGDNTDSLLQGFNSMSIDWKTLVDNAENSTSSRFLSKSKKSSAEHCVGLGGVRLDSSSDGPIWESH